MKADILVCYGTSWLDKIISAIIRDRYTHVVIDIGNDSIIETGWFGLKITPLASKNNQFIRLRCLMLSDTERQTIVNNLMAKYGYPYDYPLAFSIGINRIFGTHFNWDNHDKYVCVETAIDEYLKLGYDLLPGESCDKILPIDLRRSKLLCEIPNENY